MNGAPQLLTLDPARLLAWGVAAVALAIALVALLMWWRRGADRRRINRVLRRVCAEMLCDLVIPDGIGGVLQIDCLLLSRGGVLVIDLKDYPGTLFGAEHIDQWTQMVRGGSFKFPNPLHENRIRVQAMRALLPGVPITGRVVFTRESRFPKGVPAGTSRLDSLEEDLGALAGGEVAPAYRGAWDRFKAALAGADSPLQTEP